MEKLYLHSFHWHPGLFLTTLILLVSVKATTQPLSATITDSMNNSCYESPNGTATVTVTGGNPPYTYLWENYQTTSTATMLLGGTYDVTVTDEDMSRAITSVMITTPPRIVLTPTTTHNGCFGETDGSISLAVTGGVSPYTYHWSTGDNTNFISDLAADIYTVTITDDNTCIKTVSYSINQPDPISIGLADKNNETCSGSEDGNITIQVFGGVNPIMAEWSNGITGLSISNLPPDIYTVTVTDFHDCTYSTSYFIHPGTSVEITTLELQNVSCFGGNNGTITIQASEGDAPYTYLWSTGATGSSISNLPSNSYSVTATDSAGCIYNSSFIITEPLPISVVVDSIAPTDDLGSGLIWITVSGGTPAFTYQWIDPAGEILNTEDLNHLVISGYYSVLVSDIAGCIAILDSVYVEQAVAVEPTIPLHSLKVYPVPADDFLFIEMEQPIKEVLITGVDGRFCKRIVAPSSNKIDVSSLGKGWYLLEISDGVNWYIARMVK